MLCLLFIYLDSFKVFFYHISKPYGVWLYLSLNLFKNIIPYIVTWHLLFWFNTMLWRFIHVVVCDCHLLVFHYSMIFYYMTMLQFIYLVSWLWSFRLFIIFDIMNRVHISWIYKLVFCCVCVGIFIQKNNCIAVYENIHF